MDAVSDPDPEGPEQKQEPSRKEEGPCWGSYVLFVVVATGLCAVVFLATQE